MASSPPSSSPSPLGPARSDPSSPSSTLPSTSTLLLPSPQEVVHRDKTEYFREKRSDYTWQLKRQLENIYEKKAKITEQRIQKQKEEQQKKKEKETGKSVYASFLAPSTYTSLVTPSTYTAYLDPSNWTGAEKVTVPYDEGAAKTADKCYICNLAFSKLLRKKYYCPFCEHFVCGACCNSRIQLASDPLTDVPAHVWACNSCGVLHERASAREQFEKEVANANGGPFVYFHNVISGTFQLLNNLVPRYQHMVLDPEPTVERLTMAGEMEEDLAGQFKNFEAYLKNLSTLKLDSAKDERIRGQIKQLCDTFLKENRASFRVLIEQRKKTLAQVIAEEKERAEREKLLQEMRERGELPEPEKVDPPKKGGIFDNLPSVALPSMPSMPSMPTSISSLGYGWFSASDPQKATK